MAQVIVLGGGLAGLSAAHTVLEHGGRVLLLDKVRAPRLGPRLGRQGLLRNRCNCTCAALRATRRR